MLKRFSKFNTKKIPKNSKVCIYGAGKIGLEIKNKLFIERPDVKFLFFVDSFNHGKIDNYKIIKVEDLYDKKNEIDHVIIGSISNKNNIIETLKKHNLNNYIIPSELIIDSKTVKNILTPPSHEKFIKTVQNSPLYRKYCDNLNDKTITLICKMTDMNKIQKFVQQFKNVEIKKIYLAGFPQNPPNEVEFKFADKLSKIKTELLYEVDFLEHNNFFIFFENNWDETFSMLEELRNMDIHTFSYYCPQPNLVLQVPESANYLNLNIDSLNKSYNLIKDEYSKDLFASRVKTILSGNAGYLKSSANKEYYSKNVKPELGDYVIDVGVSENITTTHDFAKTVGKKGKVYSFEPEPFCFKSAKEQIKNLSDCNNVEIFEYGLWNKKETLQITSNGPGSSLVYNHDIQKNICKLITLDDFVKENNIKKIDLIKMDIEGAEPKALIGSINSIKKFKPKLAICLYHHPLQLFEIILFINSLNLKYEFFLDHHGLCFYETVLYAKIKQ